MRILIANHQVPFMHGGAEAHARNLATALAAHGHVVDQLTLPFYRFPPSALHQLIDFHQAMPLDQLWMQADQIIALRFPAFYLDHPNKAIWVLHQFREAFDLIEDGYPNHPVEALEIQKRVKALDRQAFLSAQRCFANSKNVARRAYESVGVSIEPLYHPPPDAQTFYQGDYLDYIFAPSRLESHKRQYLLIEAMRFVQTPVRAVIAGDGTARAHLQALIEQYELSDRVVLTGAISREEMLGYYAHCLGVYFAPHDEDYGYITLEAMLAGKAVITTHDAGGPNEFVLHGQTGFVANPDPQEIAQCIDTLCANRQQAREMGQAGRTHYQNQNITWDHVVEQLVIQSPSQSS
jgi:glycosyltransferase involved in cell wall biosynthesis